MIDVLLIDDSLVLQKAVRSFLEEEGSFVVRSATTGAAGLESIASKKPDVVLLDICLGDTDGFILLEAIVQKYQLPVVMLSSLFDKDTAMVQKALESGAAACVAKKNTEDLAPILRGEVEKRRFSCFAMSENVKETIPFETPALEQEIPLAMQDPLVLIGASTGGTMVIQNIVRNLIGLQCGTLVLAQHLPQGYSESIAERLKVVSGREVVVPQDGTLLAKGRIYLCPGGFSASIMKNKEYFTFSIQKEQSSLYKPSIDTLFTSVAACVPTCTNVLAIILTGMGKDGLLGTKALSAKNAVILAQNKESSAIYGMPRFVHEAGIASSVSVDEIIDAVNIRLHGDMF